MLLAGSAPCRDIFLPLCFVVHLFELFLFQLGDVPENNIDVLVGDLTVTSQVVAQLRKQVLVNHDDSIEGTFSDLERGQVRQEIVTDQETKEDEVVNDTLEVILVRQ